MANNKINHIKITKPTGQVSYTVFNQDTYNRLNDQNKNLAPERKSKIEQVEMTPEEVQEQKGFDENAALEMNPSAQRLISENEAKDKTILELQAQLAQLQADQVRANSGSGEDKGKKK